MDEDLRIFAADGPAPADPSCACRAESTDAACEVNHVRGAKLVGSDFQTCPHAELWILLAQDAENMLAMRIMDHRRDEPA